MTDTASSPPTEGLSHLDGFSWGVGDELNGMEAVMWRAEVDPSLRSTVLAFEVLDTLPDWDRFRAAHDWGSRLVPRFRQRIVDGPLGLGQPSWVVDPLFDLDHHVHRTALPAGSTMADAFALVSRVGNAPFERTRPPWEAILVEGLPDGQAGYLLKMHHSTLDGMAGMQLLGGLHSRTREPSPAKPQPEAPAGEDPSVVKALGRQAEKDARGLARLALGTPGRLRRMGRPDRAFKDAASYTASLKRVLGAELPPPSPLLAERTGRWHCGGLDVGFAPLRAAAKAADATLNDAFVAALLGGFRRYHEELGRPVDAIPFAIPISVRKPDDPPGGNRFAGARMSGPVGEVDPVKRMHAVGKQVRAIRAEPALDALSSFSPALARLPGPVIAQIAGGLTKGNDLQASNVPGPREALYIAGAKIERTYGFAPLPGCAAMIVLLSVGELCCIAVNTDPAAITDLPRFGRCLVEGFQEVMGPEADAPVWRA